MPQEIKDANPLPESNPEEGTRQLIQEMKDVLIECRREVLVEEMEGICEKTERNWKMMMFIIRGGEGREDKNKDRKATRS